MAHIRLRNQLLLRLLPPMCAVMLVSGVFSYELALRYSNNSQDRSLSEEARGLARQIQIVGNKVRLDLPRAAIDMLEWDGVDSMTYQVRSEHDGIISGNQNMPATDITNRDMSIDQPYFYDDKLKNKVVRIVVIRASGPADDSVWVRVATTVNRRNEVANTLVAAVIIPQLVLIIIAMPQDIAEMIALPK